MATILGLALKVTGEASSLAKSLTPVDKALASISKAAERATAVFAPLTAASSAAATAQQGFAERFAALAEQFRDTKDAVAYADAFARLADEAKNTAAAFTEGVRVTAAARTAEEDRATELARLAELLDLNAISQETYNRTVAEVSGANAEAARAESARAADSARAAQIMEANLTATERAQADYNAEVAEYERLRAGGSLGEQEFEKAVRRSADAFAKATVEAGRAGKAIDDAGKGSTLKFNELSGVLSALPGPLGSVAGRISGLASAGEGLGRVFSGGLSTGLSGIGSSVAALVNPFTLAAAGVAAFAAGATAVAQGLISLEDRVERLSRLATQLGVSFEFVQVLEEAGRRADVSVEQLSGSFGRLQNTLAGADDESKKATAALQRLGVSVEDFGDLSQAQQIELIGEKLATIEDPAQRSAAAIALFGRAGVQLLPFFNELPGAATDIERFGRAVTDLDRQRLADFGGGLDALGVAVTGFGTSLLLPFAGLGDGVATAFGEITAGLTAVIDPIGQVLEPILSNIGRLIEILGIGIGNVGRVIGAVFKPFAVVVQAVSQALEPLYDGLVDIFRSLSDGQVATAEWIMSFTPIGVLAENAALLGQTISRVATIVTTAFSQIASLIGDTLGRAAEVVGTAVSAFLEFTGLGGAISAIGDTIGSVFGSVASVFSTIASAIGGTVGRLLTMAENFLGIERSAEAASQGVEQVTESTAQLTEEQKRAATEVQKAVENSAGVLDQAIQKAGEFGQAGFNAALQFQEALADLKEQADANDLNAEQYSRGVALATAEYEEQIESLRKVQEETRKAAEESQRKADADRSVSDQLIEQARIQAEFGGDADRARAAEAVLAVERDIARIKEQVGQARDAGDLEAVANGEKRIAQLQTIQGQQQSIADGSAKAAADEANRLADQQKRIDELLNAGQEQTQIEKDIIAVQEQQRLVQAELNDARLAQNTEDANASAARLAQLDQLQAKLEEQQQAAEQGFGEGFAAAFTAVDQNIGEVINKAADLGNAGAAAALRLQEGIAAAQEQARDGILNAEAFDREVQRQQEVFNNEVENIEKADALRKEKIDENAKLRENAEKQLLDQQQKALEQQQQAQQQQQQAVAQEQARIAEERRRAEEAEFARQQERVRQLNTLGSATVKTTDVRTAEGAALVLDLAASAQDPELIEARIQTKLLNQIALGLAGAAANYFNQPVAIVGAARLGGFN
jgi:hypothetical protein